MAGLTGDQACSLLLVFLLFKDGLLKLPAPKTEPDHGETKPPETATEGADSATPDPQLGMTSYAHGSYLRAKADYFDLMVEDLRPIQPAKDSVEWGQRLSVIAMRRLQSANEAGVSLAAERDQARHALREAISERDEAVRSVLPLQEEIRLLRNEKESALKELDRMKEAVYQLQESIARDREELETYRSTDGKDGRNGPIAAYYMLAEELGVEPGGSVVETIHARIGVAEDKAYRLSRELTRVHAARVRAHNYWIAKVRRQRAQLHLMHQTIEENKHLKADGALEERGRITAMLGSLTNDLCLVRVGPGLVPRMSPILGEELRALLLP
jgi:chemotaxis protein histidine kinase CheA